MRAEYPTPFICEFFLTLLIPELFLMLCSKLKLISQ